MPGEVARGTRLDQQQPADLCTSQSAASYELQWKAAIAAHHAFWTTHFCTMHTLENGGLGDRLTPVARAGYHSQAWCLGRLRQGSPVTEASSPPPTSGT